MSTKTIEQLEQKIKELEAANEELDRKRRIAWRRYFLTKQISLPKKCPKCATGLLIERVNSKHGGIYAACSNYPLMCSYYVKDKKNKDVLNAYDLNYK